MIAAILFFVIVIISTAIGYLLRRVNLSEVLVNFNIPTLFMNSSVSYNEELAEHKTLISLPAIFLYAIALAAGVYICLSMLSTFVPSSDDYNFTNLSEITILTNSVGMTKIPLSCLASTSSGKPLIVCNEAADKMAEQTKLASAINIIFPPAVRQYEDFRISLAYATADPAGKLNEASARLSLPNSLEGRTTEACKGEEEKGVVRACVDNKTVSRPIRFHWTLTPKETGRVLIDLTTNLIDAPSAGSKKSLLAMVSQTGEKERAVSDAQFAQFGDIVVDHQNRAVSFPVAILTTLGMTQRAYDWFEVIGAIVGALGTLLGAGFLLKPFSKKSKGGDAEAPEVEEQPEETEKRGSAAGERGASSPEQQDPEDD